MIQKKKQTKTNTVQTPRPTTKTLVVWKCYYKFHHDTRSKNVNSETKPNVKNTNCPSKIIVTIHKRWQGNSLKNKPDVYMLCVIDLNYHNHPVGNSADVLRFRPVSDETKVTLVSIQGLLSGVGLDTRQAISGGRESRNIRSIVGRLLPLPRFPIFL